MIRLKYAEAKDVESMLNGLIGASSSSQSKTRAGPSWTIISGTTADLFTIPESGARLPFSAASPPVSE